MVKFTIIGSCRHGPYEVLAMPTPLDPEMAMKKFQIAIDNSDFVIVYAPEGIGEDTQKDLDYVAYRKVDYLVFPDDSFKARLYEGLGLDLSVLRFEHELSTLTREVEYLQGKGKDDERLRSAQDRELKRLKTAVTNIEKEYMKWKRLARAEDCMTRIGAVVERLNL